MNSTVFNSFSPYLTYNIPVATQKSRSNDYLTANLAQNTASNTDDFGQVDEKTVGMAALLQAIALGLQKGSSWLARKLESGKEFTSDKNVKKIAEQMVRDNKLGNVTVDYISNANKHKYAGTALAKEIEVVAKGQNAFYADSFKLAVAPENKPSLILHELGHACNSKNSFMQLLQKSRKYAMGAPMALLFLSKMFGKDKDGRPNFIERNAGKLGFAAFLPTIIEEGVASWRGINAIKKVPKNILEGNLNTNILKRNYLFALGTYILAGIGLGVASKQTILQNANTNS